MVRYSVFSSQTISSANHYVIVKNCFNIWVLIFGPIIFLFHRMWFNFVLYITILVMLNLFYIKELTSFLVVKFIELALYLYLAFDFSNLKERFLVSKGYKFLGSEYYDRNLMALLR